MASQAWKQCERDVARLIKGHRYPANSGGRLDCESPRFVCQVKNVKTCSLATLEALALEMETLGRQRGKTGLVCVKRRNGRGCKAPRLFVLTERAFADLVGGEHAQ